VDLYDRAFLSYHVTKESFFLYLKKPLLGPLPSSTAKWTISVAAASGVCHSVESAFSHLRVKSFVKR
jgi:hypothetical protein